MVNVYLLTLDDYDYSPQLGFFTTLEKAQSFLGRQTKRKLAWSHLVSDNGEWWHSVIAEQTDDLLSISATITRIELDKPDSRSLHKEFEYRRREQARAKYQNSLTEEQKARQKEQLEKRFRKMLDKMDAR